MSDRTTASGGFVSRAERKAVEFASVASNRNVGPGTYNGQMGQNLYLTAPSSVPFLTSTDRPALDVINPAAHNPGPGAYNTASAQDALTGRYCGPSNAALAFASGMPRMSADLVAKQAVPGPGSYEQGNGWVKRNSHYEPPVPRTRGNWDRVANPPSIPARQQSYGYEEGAEGRLVMQGSPERVTAGVGLDSVGPGRYDPTPLPSPGPDKAPAWGSSRSRRTDGPKQLTSAGPGSYDVAVGGVAARGMVVHLNGVDVVFGGTNGTSSFVTRTTLNHQKERAQQYLDDPSLVRAIVADGADHARKLAQDTMRDVREAMGLSYS
ncbi:MAG: hypothetical protein WDW38_011476 [Sanguina aurantia]